MKKDIHLIRLSVESMARLMEELVAEQKECGQCCRTVELPPDDPVHLSAASTVPAVADGGMPLPPSVPPRLIPPPDPLAGQLDVIITPAHAANLLCRGERQVARYRASGKLTFVDDDGEGRSGYWLSQVRRLYFDFNGRWPV